MADHNLRASGYALYGTAVFGAEQYGGHVRSGTEVSTPNLTVHILSATSVETTSEISTVPALGQSHTLLPISAESSSEVTVPDIDELNILDATDVSSSTTLTLPGVGQSHSLTSVGSESLVETSTPVLGEVNVLTAVPVETTSEVQESSVLGHGYTFTNVSTEAASEVTTTPITQSHTLTSVGTESSPEVSTPVINQAHVILVSSTETPTETSAPVVTQLHIVTATSVETTSEVTSTAAVWELPPFEQDTDFTIYIPEQNTNVRVGPQDYTNQVIVPPENRQIRIAA
jgi:hypothetical protein